MHVSTHPLPWLRIQLNTQIAFARSQAMMACSLAKKKGRRGWLELVVEVLLVLIPVLVVELVLEVVEVALAAVARVDALLDHLVLVRELLGLADHALDLLVREAALLGGDGDLLRLARALVLGADLQ